MHTLYIHWQTHTIHPLCDQANTHPTSTVRSSKHTPYIHCAIKQTHTLHPLSDQTSTHPTSTVRSSKRTPLSDQANTHPTSTVRSSKRTPYIHCQIKLTHTLHPLSDQANTHPTSVTIAGRRQQTTNLLSQKLNTTNHTNSQSSWN